MSSYHSSFTYLNKNSINDFGWIVVSLDPDNGEMDSGLSQEQVYADSYRGTKRFLYGTKYNSVPVVKITVIKCNGLDFTKNECRSAYRWLTGNPNATWLSLYFGNDLQYEFLGTVQDVKPYKLDARTVALTIYFESISPWAYSSLQTFECSFGQELFVKDGILHNGNDLNPLKISNDGIISINKISDTGILYFDNSVLISIDNQTDDLYEYTELNTIFTNNNSDYLSIKNETIDEETIITNMSLNEVITFDAGQFITSDIPNKIFGNNFNFIWPKLAPGINNLVISGSGSGSITFTYRYPIKIGDCAIDILDVINDLDCGCNSNNNSSNNNSSCYIDEQGLRQMLNEILM